MIIQLAIAFGLLAIVYGFVTSRQVLSASAGNEKMQEIDRRGAFEKDDEAGTTFQMLNQVIITLKTQFDGEESEEE